MSEQLHFDWTDETGRRNRRMKDVYEKIAKRKYNLRSITPEQFNAFVEALHAAFDKLTSWATPH